MTSLPPELWATIACFAGNTPEGNVARAAAGTVRIKHRDRYSRPYVNGLLHSWDGREPIVMVWEDQPYDEQPYDDDLCARQTHWRCDGKLHRDDDLPAIIDRSGAEFWYQHGLLHRDGDKPAAFDLRSGRRQWYQRGSLHRDNDQPAVIQLGKYKCWFQHGKMHRDNDQPAVLYDSGSAEWYQNDRLHRDGDLPALVFYDGTRLWYQHGLQHRAGDRPAAIRDGGDRVRYEWFRDGQLHRDWPRPAVVEINVRESRVISQEWRSKGRLVSGPRRNLRKRVSQEHLKAHQAGLLSL